MKYFKRKLLKSKVVKRLFIFLILIIIPTVVLMVFAVRLLNKDVENQIQKELGKYKDVVNLAEREINSFTQKIELNIRSLCISNDFTQWELVQMWPKLQDIEKSQNIQQVFLLDRYKNVVYPFEITKNKNSLTYEMIPKWTSFVEIIKGYNKAPANQNLVRNLTRLFSSYLRPEQQGIICNKIADCYGSMAQADKSPEKDRLYNLESQRKQYDNIQQKYSFYKELDGRSLGVIAYLKSAEIYSSINIKETERLLFELSDALMANKWGVKKYEFEKTINEINTLIAEKIPNREDLKLKVKELNKKAVQRLNKIRLFEKDANYLVSVLQINLKEVKLQYFYGLHNKKDYIIYWYPIADDKNILGYLGVQLNWENVRKSLNESLANVSGSSEIDILNDKGEIVLSTPFKKDKPYSNRGKNLFYEDIIKVSLPLQKIIITPKDPSAFALFVKNKKYIYISVSVILMLFIIAGVILTVNTVFKELELARIKSDFVSNVSHELKTPLAIISLIAEKLQLGRIREQKDTKEYYDIIVQESKRLRRLIENVLDFSRIEEGRKQFNFRDENISKLLNGIVTSFQYHANQYGFSVACNIENNIKEIKIDKGSIEQAIFNLLDNAMKYSKDKKEIVVNLKKVNSKIYIEVIDYGVGINKNELEKIFDKFYRVGDELTREVKGAGLGLSIVKYIALAHNGDILVESEEGKGSKFTLVLPDSIES